MTIWYVMRGSGLVAFALLTVTVVLGVANITRWQRGRWTRAVVALVHRNASLLAVVFLAIHVATAVEDTYVHVTLPAVLVPGVSSYRALWVALGTIALDLLLALIVTSLLRARVGRRAWRAVHWAAYAAWPVALGHAVGTGTDTGKAWTTAVYAAAGTAVLAAVAVRTAGRRRSARPALAAGRGRPAVAPPAVTSRAA